MADLVVDFLLLLCFLLSVIQRGFYFYLGSILNFYMVKFCLLKTESYYIYLMPKKTSAAAACTHTLRAHEPTTGRTSEPASEQMNESNEPALPKTQSEWNHSRLLPGSRPTNWATTTENKQYLCYAFRLTINGTPISNTTPTDWLTHTKVVRSEADRVCKGHHTQYSQQMTH